MIRARSVPAAVLAGVVLAGCGVADNTVARPGAAAVVEGTTISVGDVDGVAGDICGYLSDAEAAAEQPPVSRGDVRSQVLQLLVQRAAAEQFLDDNGGAELYSGYAAALAEAEQSTPELPTDQREALRVATEASTYYQAVLLGVGIELLGVTDEPGADLEAANERGTAAFSEWLADHEVSVNPLYGVAVEDGAIVVADATELSVPVGEVARRDDTSLPPDQLCG